MKVKTLYSLIGVLILFIIILVILYICKFHESLSPHNSDWGDFGGYIAGTAGTLLSLLTVLLVYNSFIEQRKQRFESVFQQYISDYYNLLNLIRERWLHKAGTDENPIYQSGREIFGHAIGHIEGNNEEFIKIFHIHINVFEHYCNYLVGFCTMINENKELTQQQKQDYTLRFGSMLSFFESCFFAYYVKFLYQKNDIDLMKNLFLPKMQSFLSKDLSFLDTNVNLKPHIKSVEFITNQFPNSPHPKN